jgi:hypothetical protein
VLYDFGPGEDGQDGQTAVVQEADGMVSSRVVGRDRRRGRAPDDVLRSRNGRLARRIGTVIESVDVSCHHSVGSWEMCGYGRAIDDPEIPGVLEKGTRVFSDGVYLMADCFGLQLDEVTFSCEFGECTKDVDLGWYKLPKASSAPTTSSTRAWSAVLRGSRRTSNGK